MNNEKKKDILMILTFSTLSLSLVSTITYMIYTIVTNGSFIDHIISILGVIVLAVFALSLVIAGFFIENKTAKLFITICSVFLTLYSIIQLAIGINTPKELLPNFVNKDVNTVISWAKDKKIELIKEFEYSDDYEAFHIIRQDIKEGTDLRKVKSLKIVISNGIDKTKVTKVDDMVGWNLDDVITFIDDNKLTNVTINFTFSNTTEKDIIISQDVIKEITRNEPITLTCSLGREANQKSVVMEDLVGMDLFHATIYLKRNNIKYSIVYTYDKDKKDIVLKQSIKPYEVIGTSRNQEMVLTISKPDLVTIPDFSKMTIDQIDNWATQNKMIIEYQKEYDDTIKQNKVISFNVIPGNTIETYSIIKIIISDGQLKMIEFTDVSSFEDWAKENKISYSISYEISNEVAEGKLISASHKKNDIIKNNDTIKLVISEGSYTTVPNFIGLKQNEAQQRCTDNKLKCTFTYQDNNNSYTTISKQSMKINSQVPVNTSITLTLGQ